LSGFPDQPLAPIRSSDDVATIVSATSQRSLQTLVREIRTLARAPQPSQVVVFTCVLHPACRRGHGHAQAVVGRGPIPRASFRCEFVRGKRLSGHGESQISGCWYVADKLWHAV